MLEEKYYRVPEITELLKVTKRTVYNWIYSGKLPAIKAGQYIVKQSDLEAFLANKK